MIGRELLNLIGCNINWVLEPAANCFRIGNHLGIQPHGFKDSLDFAADELEEITGIRVDVPINRKGAEVLFVMPSADYFGTPHYYTLLGYLIALPRDRPGLHLQRLCLRGRQLRPVHLARDDEAAERQDLRRSQAPGREVDPRRRVRPHVARASPVHGHDERPGRFS